MNTTTKSDTLTADVRFSQVPEWLIDHPDLTDKALRLYVVLARYADSKTRTAFPGRKTLAKRIGSKSTSTVDRAMVVLEAVGAVNVTERVFDDNGEQTSNHYLLRFGSPLVDARKIQRVDRDFNEVTPAAYVQPPSRTDEATPGRTDATQTITTVEREPLNDTQIASKATRPKSELLTEHHQVMEALVSAVGWNRDEVTAPQWGVIRKASKELRDLNPPPTLDEIHRRAVNYRLNRPDVTLTPRALVGAWAESAQVRTVSKKQVERALRREEWRNA